MTETDEQLARRIAQGDRAAFAELLDRHEKMVFNVVYRLVSNYDDALDVTQAVFTKLYTKIHGFDPQRRLFSWLYKIAVNESLNHLGKQKRRRQNRPLVGSELPTPEEECLATERDRSLQAALREVPSDYRVVLILKYYLDLSYREIGTALEISDKTVKSRLFTARKLLRTILLKQGYA
jgi:RNA polymerase sigma-70 factor (ECF subfamily)